MIRTRIHTPPRVPVRASFPRRVAAAPVALLLPLAAVLLPTSLAAQTADPAYDTEIERLQTDPRVREALALLESSDERTIAEQIELTQIPAPPFMEDARAARFLEMMRDLGVDSAWIDTEGNAIALRRGTGDGPVVALTGHLDTVFPEGTDVTVRMVGDTLYAPGVSDDVRGLTAVLAVLRAMNETELRTGGDILFVGTVGEEGLGDLRGVKHLFRDGGPRIDAFLSVDGPSDSRVTHQALGSYRYRITFQGPGGHSWGAFGLANPAHALGRAVRLFDDEAADFTAAAGPRTSYNVGVLGGGTSVNSVPFEAWMEIDMRSESPASLDRIDAILLAAVEEGLEQENAARTRGEPLTVDVERIGTRPSGEIPVASPLVQRSIAATRALGLEPGLGRSSTDSNIPISLGIPAVTLGGGGTSGNAHSLDEWFLNTNGPRGIQRVLLVTLAQAGLAPVGAP
ncbi:MAG: M20/M25/M40 family metallo-hydrolase [Gemmatimonadetes bacterium]|nr:M20/M25/M40 family metallo-hydrolase [Gemmatimonadota bacterium]NNK62814.1 M20/M25/M40 family metallo-hydrolase [Gemmatimonadota bacterium]